MILDDLRSYLQMASGLTEATTGKARDIVGDLMAQGLSFTAKAVPAPEMMGQVQELAEDLVSTSRENREALLGLIRAEVDKAVGRMGFVREDELAALRRHVQRLEQQMDAVRAAAGAATAPASDAPGSASGARAGAANGADEPEQPAATHDDAPAPAKKRKKVVVDQGAE
jgi:polyhydroxyalkanoate synthesis regulator phasin